MFERAWRAIGVLALLGLLGSPGLASATLLRPLSLDDLIHKADRVLVAEVIGARCVAEGGRIYTHTEVRVREELRGKGQPTGSTLLVRQLGGELDGLVMGIAGTPELRPGAAYLLFLDSDDRGQPYHYVVGFSQGVYRVDATGEELHRPKAEVVRWAGTSAPAADSYRLRAVRERLAAPAPAGGQP